MKTPDIWLKNLGNQPPERMSTPGGFERGPLGVSKEPLTTGGRGDRPLPGRDTKSPLRGCPNRHSRPPGGLETPPEPISRVKIGVGRWLMAHSSQKRCPVHGDIRVFSQFQFFDFVHHDLPGRRPLRRSPFYKIQTRMEMDIGELRYSCLTG